jgi:uracil-DNA glycosylase family 4
MSGGYNNLVEAAIQHLEGLKARGGRFVALSPEALDVLRTGAFAAPAVRPARPATPVAARAVAPSPNPQNPAAPTVSAKAAMQPAASGQTAKAVAIDALRKKALACVKCSHLAAVRKNVVFGVGNPEAELMFVGEAPGADEDIQGEPFVGRAGELLTKIIEAMGLSRERVYIANILKCRPDMPPGSSGNRKPTPEEMQTCIPFLHEQIDIIQPKALVGLGGTAIEGLLGQTAGITRLRGNWQTYRDIPLMPTFHPSYVLRNQSAETKRQVWEDMLQVMEKLQMPITEKQRAYFRKASA